MITQITDPQWNPITDEWVFGYTVVDPEMGKYLQIVHAENIKAARRYIDNILSIMAKNKQK